MYRGLDSQQTADRNAQVARDALKVLEAAEQSGTPDQDLVFTIQAGGTEHHLTLSPGLRKQVHTLLEMVALGQEILLVQHDSELTPSEAADVLNVSRPYVVKLLDSGELPYRKVGSHRRIPADAVQDYKQATTARRQIALDEMTREADEHGDYLS